MACTRPNTASSPALPAIAFASVNGRPRSMMTYIGATQLKEVPKRTTFVRVTAQTNDVFGG